jgi:hypothetical protein
VIVLQGYRVGYRVDREVDMRREKGVNSSTGRRAQRLLCLYRMSRLNPSDQDSFCDLTVTRDLHCDLHQARHISQGNTAAVVPSEEARALYEWLHANPAVRLEMIDLVSQTNSDAAVFIVRSPPASSRVSCT